MDGVAELGINMEQSEIGTEDTLDFPISRAITKEVYEIAQRKGTEETLGFGFPLVRTGPKEKGYIAQFTAHGGSVDITVNLPEDVGNTLPQQQREGFQISEGGKKLSYPKRENQQSKSSPEHNDFEYCIEGYDRRFFQEYERKAQAITSEDLARIIHETPSEGVIFYTGAGISRGGEAPVWDMGTLNSELHLEGTYDRDDPQGAMKTFLPAFMENPEALAQKFNEFKELLYADVSTPAHIAISEIVEANPGSIIFTENVDLKHEAEGSRYEAIHMDSRPETFSTVKERSSKAQLLITVGLGSDDRAVISYLKDKNPNLKIVALALPPKHEGDIPSFLQNDFALYGDCQQLLPEVAQQIRNLEQSKTPKI